MLVEGTNKISLFNVMSTVDQELQQKARSENDYEFGKDDLPDWFLDIEKTARREMKFNAAFNNDIPPVPTPEDFFAFPFRHLSATIVGGGTWKATDFTKESALRASTQMLTNVPAYMNHHLEAGREIGFVGEATYRRTYKNQNGDQVPGGVEAPFIIDSVLHGDLVRKMNSPVSPIDSSSVTVLFNWKASHEFEDDRDFFWHLGETIDDEMVRRVVEEIVQYEESSLVWSGADPYAKMLDENGQVTNIDKANAFAKSKFSNDPELQNRDWGKKYFVFDCLDEAKVLHLSKSVEQLSKSHNMDKELLKFLASVFGTTEAEIEAGKFTSDQAKAFSIMKAEDFSKIKTNADAYATAVQERDTAQQTIEANKVKVEAYDKVEKVLTEEVGAESFDQGLEEVSNLVTFKKENEKYAEQGRSHFEALQKKAKEVYNSFSQGKPDEAIVKKIDEATTPQELSSFITMWGGKLSQEFSAHCTKCDSGEHIQFQSSVTPDPEPKGDNDQEQHLALKTLEY